MNPDHSAGKYVTVSVEAECRLIYQNRDMKEEEKMENIKVNALKRATHMNQHRKSFAKLCEANANLPNDTMESEDPSTPNLQVLLSLSTDIIKESYHCLGGKMSELPD